MEMTYRPGAHVVDTHSGRVGELVAGDGGAVRLRPPGGGGEWLARPDALRLAHADELKQARGAVRGESPSC